MNWDDLADATTLAKAIRHWPGYYRRTTGEISLCGVHESAFSPPVLAELEKMVADGKMSVSRCQWDKSHGTSRYFHPGPELDARNSGRNLRDI